MVYYGPSKGCSNCRRRKVRCDLNDPCLRCLRRHETCPGPGRSLSSSKRRNAFASTRPPCDGDYRETHWLLRIPNSEAFYTLLESPRRSKQHSSSHDGPKATGTHTDRYHETLNNFNPFIPLSKIPRTPHGGGYGNARMGHILIDSKLCELLHFWRSRIAEPCDVYSESMNLGTVIWQNTIRHLANECGGYAFLTAIARVHITVTSSNQMFLMEATSRAKALILLQQEITVFGISHWVLSSMLALLYSEILSRDYQSATRYTEIIARHIFDLPPPEDGVPEPIILQHSYLWAEIQRATQAFAIPAVDLDRCELWLATLGKQDDYNPFEWKAEKPDEPDDLAEADLTKLFAEIRHYHALLGTSFAQHNPSIKLSLRLLLLCGRLLTFCVTEADKLSRISRTRISYFGRAQRLAAALAALWWLRLFTRLESAAQVSPTSPVMEAYLGEAPQIVDRISSIMRDTERYGAKELALYESEETSSRSLSANLRLRIWIFHIGSMIERVLNLKQGKGFPHTYHTEQLAFYLHDTGLEDDREQQIEVYEEFLPYRQDLEHGPMWLSPVPRIMTPVENETESIWYGDNY